jgi:drug/metabolite transporter (DMT)-like permease
MHWGVYNWVLFLLLAASFGVPWLFRKDQPSNWTKYPALGFLSIAILSFILGERFQVYWLASIMFIVGGLFLLAIFNRKLPSATQTGPGIKV